MRPIPEHLTAGPFTTQAAMASGVPRHLIRGGRFRSPVYGVRTAHPAPDTLLERCRAHALVLPCSDIAPTCGPTT